MSAPRGRLDLEGGWPALTIAPTLEGAPFKLRLGGAFLCGSARSGKFRGVLVPVPSTETRFPHHSVLPSDSAGNSTTANAQGDPRVYAYGIAMNVAQQVPQVRVRPLDVKLGESKSGAPPGVYPSH